MEISRPRPSILSLFDPLSLELDGATSSDSDKENDTSDFFKPAGTLKHIYVPTRTLKRRLVDVGDITVEQPDMNDLLSDELEQEISYIVDDDENDTLTFRDMAKAATPKWSSRHATETPKVSSPRTPLSEISLKDELTPLARKKPYKRQLVPSTPKGSESACLVFPPSTSSGSSSSSPPSYTEVPEVRVNDEPVPQCSSIPANSLGDSSESLLPHTLNQSTPAETLVTDTLPSSLVVPAPCSAQPRTRHLSPTSPADNANRYSVDLQTSFQIHFPSHDTTFDLLKDKISFFGSGNEFDSYLNNLEGDSSLDDDNILIPGSGSKIEMDSMVPSAIALNQVQSVVKSDKLIEHPTPLSKDVGVTEPSIASHARDDTLSLVQPFISNRPLLVGDTKANQATFAQPHVFHPPLPLVVDNSRPMSTPPTSFVDKSRYLPPQIPALRIVKRSKTINQQKPSFMAKDGPPQDVLIPLGCRVPSVTEAPASSSLTKITKKGRPSEVSQFQRTDKANFPPSLASNGPRRVLISEGPKLNLARTSEQVKPSSTSGPRRVAMTVPSTVMERASTSAKPHLVQPSSGLRQPVKRTGVVKPVQRTVGSRLPAITRRIGGSGKVDERRKARHEQYDLEIVSPSLHDDPAFSTDPHSNPYSVTSRGSYLSPPPPGHPVLKNSKKRPNIALESHSTPDSDSDFQLVQPPNSPDIPGGSTSSPQSPMTTNPLTMYNKIPTISSASSSMNQGLNPSVMSQGGRRPTVLKKENKQRNFLSRSNSAQAQPITPFFSSMGNDRRRSDLPSFRVPGDTVLPQPVQHNEGLPTSASVAPQMLGHRGRTQDLDQIDVLDETNPWGIRIHHDGPYEAVKGQANKRANRVPLGLASSNGLYNAHALQANDQTYIPPQVTAGMSLNLSPGQIFPRQFPVPSIQPAVSSTLPGPYTPHFPARPLLSPPNEPQYAATLSDAIDSGSIRNDLPAIQETTQHDDDISSSIGMAMLKLTDDAPGPVPSLHAFLSQAESSDEENFDYFNEDRRVPSPPFSAQAEPSRGQANQSSQNTSSTGIRPVGHLRNNSDPPMYSEHIDDGHRLLNEQRQVQSSSQSSQKSQNPEILVGAGPQRHSNGSDNGSFLSPDRYAPSPPAFSRDQRVEVAQRTQYTSPAQTSTPFYHSHRDGLPLTSVNHRNEPDVQSTHYSASIYSSGQFQSGRRPPQHLPKRLVMPSPLNTGPPPNAAPSLYDSRGPPSQTSSYVNVKQFHPTPSHQHYSHRSSNPPMAPMQYRGNTRAQDIPVFEFGGRKLRKKASVIVSFTPPIVEFHRNDDKRMTQSRPESKPKRLLSKGRR